MLASTPFNVAVGGTEFNEGTNASKYWSSQNNGTNLGSALSYIPEDSWNESCSTCQFPNLYSSGGGVSQYNPKPTWQFGVPGIPNDGARDVPDVALTAAAGHDPYILCLEGSCVPDQNGYISLLLIGGTSAAAPSFAGIMALVENQNGQQGLANYVLYRLAAAETNLSQCNASSSSTLPASTCVFNDVTMGNNTVPGVQGFSAATGYDLATGLGSVNVANLVNNWNTVNFTGTTTTLSPASITAIHGAPVTLNVKVSPTSGNGVPTGDAALIAGFSGWNNRAGISPGFLTLSKGAASAQVHDLPGGTYSLTAQYAGDATFAPSPASSPTSVNISPENSTTNVSVLDQNGNPFTGGPYGSLVYVRADVKGNSGYGIPTGLVAFGITESFGGASPSGNLNSQGDTSFTATWFSVGPVSVNAHYYGDVSFNSSNSSAVAFIITPAATTTSLQATGAQQGAVLTATISTASLASPPTGSVTFYNGSTNLGSGAVSSASGPLGVQTTAWLNAGQLTNGQYSITATYSGDSNYSSSTSSPVQITIQPDFSIQASSTLVIAAPGQSASMPINVTALDGFTGSVAFSCSGLPSEASCTFSPASVSSTGITNLTISTKPPIGMLEPRLGNRSWTLSMAMLLTPLGGMLIFGVSAKRRRWRLVPLMLLFALLPGCGGGGGSNSGPLPNPGTPAGIYVVTLTASSGSLTHTLQFGLSVQ
ncbi:MAG TPA: Ig-like domain repeat protein [Terriglobales bacterium]